MRNDMIAQAIIITYRGVGVQIHKFDDTDTGIVLLFSVPKSSYRKDANDIEMSGKHLAQRVKQTLIDTGMVFADCRFKTRDEHWTEEMAKNAKKMAYKDLGYKDWQIK